MIERFGFFYWRVRCVPNWDGSLTSRYNTLLEQALAYDRNAGTVVAFIKPHYMQLGSVIVALVVAPIVGGEPYAGLPGSGVGELHLRCGAALFFEAVVMATHSMLNTLMNQMLWPADINDNKDEDDVLKQRAAIGGLLTTSTTADSDDGVGPTKSAQRTESTSSEVTDDDNTNTNFDYPLSDDKDNDDDNDEPKQHAVSTDD